MGISKALFSKGNDEWETPQDVFNLLDNEFHFDLDPCATESNRKCVDFFSIIDDGLSKDWGGGACFATRLTAT